MDPLIAALWIAPLAATAGLLLFPWRKDYPERTWCLSLLLPPVSCLVWGWLFGVNPGHYAPAPWWKEGFIWTSLLVSFGLGLYMTMSVARRFWLSGALLSVAAFATTLLLCFLSSMQVTGNWI